MTAILRRMQPRQALGRLRVGDLEVDPASREVRLRGRRVELSQKEFALLRALAASPTRVYTKEELLRDVWGFRSMGATRTLDSHACRLRQKLGTGGDRFVVNVWGVGYRLVDGPVEDDVSALAYAGWTAALCAGCGLTLLQAAARRGTRELVADAGHELRGPLCAARLGLHGLDDAERAAAVDLELRRAALALEDLVEAGRGRRAGRALASSSTSAPCSTTPRRRGGRSRVAFGAALAVEPLRGGRSCAPTRCGSRRRAATSSPTRSSTAPRPCACAGACSRGACAWRSRTRGRACRCRSSRLVGRRRRGAPRGRGLAIAARHRGAPRRAARRGALRTRGLPRARAAERGLRPVAARRGDSCRTSPAPFG